MQSLPLTLSGEGPRVGAGGAGGHAPAEAHERLQAGAAPAAQPALRRKVLLASERVTSPAAARECPSRGTVVVTTALARHGEAETSSGGVGARFREVAAAAAVHAADALAAAAVRRARGGRGTEAVAAAREGHGGVVGGRGRGVGLAGLDVRQHRHEGVPHVVHGPVASISPPTIASEGGRKSGGGWQCQGRKRFAASSRVRHNASQRFRRTALNSKPKFFAAWKPKADVGHLDCLPMH